MTPRQWIAVHLEPVLFGVALLVAVLVVLGWAERQDRGRP
jgi:hypothetical protein